MVIDPTDGQISWTPINAQVGEQLVVVRVIDNQGDFVEQIFAVTVSNVNQSPVISSVPDLAVTELQLYSYQINAVDPDLGDVLTYALTNSPTGMTIDAATGLVSWTPQVGQQGSVNVAVRVQDAAGLFDTQSFTLVVSEFNLSPNITSGPVAEATATLLYSYQVTATDGNNDPLTFSLGEFPEGMVIDALSGLVSWTPTDAQIGSHPVTVIATDPRGGAGSQSFTIIVEELNVAPSIDTTSLPDANEDQLYVQTLLASDANTGDSIAYTVSSGPTSLRIDANTGEIRWLPVSNNVGANSVTLRVTDIDGLFDEQTFTINVVNSDDAPVITSEAPLSGNPDELYAYQVEASDADGGVLTYSLTEAPAGMLIDTAGLINWTPLATQAGTQQVAIRVTDTTGLFVEQSFAVSVGASSVPLAPQILSLPFTEAVTDTTYQYQLFVNDPNNDVLTYALDVAPQGLSINPNNGLINWVPANTQIGAQAVVVRVTDPGGLFDTQSFAINVTDVPANNPPSISSIPDTSATENIQYIYNVVAADSDGNALSYSLDNAPDGMSVDSAGVVTWTPTTAQQGLNNVVIRVDDGSGAYATQTYSIAVSGAAVVNQPPSISSVPDTLATENTLYTYNVVATDSDGNTLAYSLDDAPSGMTIDSNGMVTWTPTTAQQGLNNVVVRVDDGNGAYATQTFSIAVGSVVVNQSPVITSSPAQTATLNNVYTYAVIAIDSDGDSLSYNLTSSPAGMNIVASSGAITWTPNAAQLGVNNVAVNVQDGNGGSATQTFSIVVGSATVNQSPVITSSPVSLATFNNVYTYNVSALDSDGDVLSYSLTSSPVGMTIVASNGAISWTPNATQLGVNNVTVTVQDNNGGAATQTFSITVGGAPGDLSPVISTLPDTTASTGVAYSYDMDAIDPQGNALVYSLQSAPLGMSIDAATGVVSWTPDAAQLGANDVVIRAATQTGEFATQTFAITVDGGSANQSPIITSFPSTLAKAGEEYRYSVLATDADADTLSFALLTMPAGMVIDNSSGEIVWTPSQDQVGTNAVSIRVDDANGGIATQEFVVVVSESLLVASDTERPIVILNLSADSAAANDNITISLTAIDNVAIATQELLVDGAPVALNSAGQAVFTSSTAGTFAVEAIVMDAAGNQGSANGELTFTVDTGDTTPPVINITAPAESTILAEASNIIGSVTDDNLSRYVVDYSIQGANDYLRLVEQTTAVTDDVLATFDPTTLRNGFYDIRITAEDTNGNVSVETIIYEADGEAKIGHFSLQDTDLNISVAGIPMTVIRKYDSRDKSTGDFGAAWNLQINNIEISENGPLGIGWRQTVGSSFFFPVYQLSPTREHKVTVTFPDGRVDEFGVGLSPASSVLFPFGTLIGTSLEFTPLGDTASSLVALDNVRGTPQVNADSSVQILNGSFFSTTDVLNPTRYQLTDDDGTVYIISQETGLEKLTDTNGNTLTIGRNGIIHSSGKSIVFTRDSADRITTITDPNNNVISYEYDFYGDLVGMTNRSGDKTTFKYNSSHGLIELIDPRGVSLTRNEYDEDGRLVAVIDPDGNRTEITTDIASRQQTVTDRLGNSKIIAYDANGYVTSETDALGNTKSYTYDALGRINSETDALGNTTSRTFDVAGNILTETDALGNVASKVFDASGRELSFTDVRGNTATNTYDARGNLLSTTDAAGNVTSFTVNGSGLPTTIVNAFGDTTNYTYDAFGNVSQSVNSLGHVMSFTRDQNGNVLTRTVKRTLADGSEANDITQYTYDEQDRVISETDPLGNIEYTEYDAVGNVVAKIDALGRRMEMFYDGNNRLIEKRYPDGLSELSTYDAEGNKLTHADRNGNVTQHVYDAAYRLIRTVHPDGSEELMEYDAAGRMTATIDANGNRTSYEYDANGRNTRIVDALGGEQLMEYDAAANMTKQTDANGNETFFTYNELGLMLQTSLADGNSITQTFNVNRLATTVNQLGQVTQNTYDLEGRLISVQDPLGDITRYTYDEADNRTSQTDAEGKLTLWSYNALNQQTAESLPLGHTKTSVYDAVDRLVSQTDFNGDATTYSFDVNDRPISISYADGQGKTFTYDANGNRLSATVVDTLGVASTTTYTYDSRDRLLSEVKPDGHVLSYQYDNVGNRLEMRVTKPDSSEEVTRYTFDQLNRLETVTDPAGAVTSYIYDAHGNMISVSYPNNTVHLYNYDALHRVIGVQQFDGVGALQENYSYTLDAMGKVISAFELGGRSVTYAYDNANRVVQEVIVDAVNGNHTANYFYDSVGNRVRLNANGTNLNYLYDDNDRLTQVGSTLFTYDNNGNTLTETVGTDTTSYSYDASNKLSSVVKPSLVSFDFTYDADDNRIAKTEGGNQVSYLIDRNRKYAQAILESDGASETSYTYGHDLVSQRVDGQDQYYHYDRKGTVKSLTNAASNEVVRYNYDAYGVLLNQAGTAQNSHRYTGEYFDEDLGHYYLRARNYNPTTGRFTQMDTWEGDTGRPASLNKYVYAHSDPVNNVDPSGRAIAINMAFTMSISIRLAYVVVGLKIAVAVLALHIAADLIHTGIMMMVNSNAGRYPANSQADMEHQHYKDFCDKQRPSKGGGRKDCAALLSRIKHMLQCISLVENWDARWAPGRHRGNRIMQHRNSLRKLRGDYAKHCT